MATEESGSSSKSICKIMTFRPTMEEFKNFSKYIAYMESQGAHRAGLAKVIPPEGWKPRRNYDNIDNLVIPAPIQQMVTGQSGLFTQYNIQKKQLTVKEFKCLANSDNRYCTPRHLDYEDLERKYWKNLTFVAPIYGADVSGSLYDEDIDEWNISRLNTILDVVAEESGIAIEGVNTPYLYFGMWKTTFAWHTEDMDLYSINYLHFGEPKSWYAVPPEHGKRLERLAQGFFPSSSQGCDAFLRHKMTLISPSILKKYGIPFDKCTCRNDMVKISMDIFVEKFQPSRYTLWKQGKDIQTIDHTKPTPESTPELEAWQKQRKATPRKSRMPVGSLYQLRTRSKKLKPLEDETALSKPVTKETTAAKTFTDVINIKEELGGGAQKEESSNTEIVSTGEESIVEIQLDQNQLDKTQLPEFASNLANTKCKNKANGKRKLDDCLSLTPMDKFDAVDNSSEYSEDTNVDLKIQVETNTAKGLQKCKEEDMLHKKAKLCQKSFDDIATETEQDCWKRRETSSVSTEEETSEAESGENGLEPGEIPSFPEQFIRSVGKKKSAKSRRHPLCKPPARSPSTLVKQELISDEELVDSTSTEEEVNETQPWAKPLIQLWQNKPHNFQAEKEYNEEASKMEPYCAICSLFFPYYQPDHLMERRSQIKTETAELPPSKQHKTKPLIPEMCFTYSEENNDLYPTNSFIEEDGTSLLISCAKCCLQVHASCYGVPLHEIHDGWTCSRCIIGAWTADCCLCNLRGGALKQTTDKRWAHVMCAVAVPEARFANVVDRSPVDVTRIPLQRLKLKCVFCRKRVKKTLGACIQCSYGRCPTSFHVTCAHAAGVIMEPDDWPYVVLITCFRHKTNPSVKSKTLFQDLSVGQTVISKHKNGRYYSCRVTGISSQTFYQVIFDDGSFSDDLYPEDIASKNCLELGPPAEGEVVQVRWTDGLLYGAKFVASNIIYMYQVEFEDGSQLVVKRDDVYTLDEELPKRVKSRLSSASDMRYEATFSTENVQAKKRPRVLNSKFMNEYVDDPGYRTFLGNFFQTHCRQGQ
ncbi:lysine-specific demethylase 4C-like isoform X4 [Carcharodon carcharias]|uniref:lysine-specific demethylase 4C-like isoform X4 n=1 Tax=Carcharodon carcharias TaxID=13397 RepID=UPI001B7E6C50|nr:lysine-specific demethylase 4C-like isoform X4 [Carcharodon carcharias]